MKKSLDKFGSKVLQSNRDAQLSKEVLLTALLRQTFYPALKEDAKEAASIWHKMEDPICNELFQALPSLLAAFRVGLVEKVDEPCVKDNADFLTLSEDGCLKFVVTEIRTRIAIQTVGQENNRIDRVNAQRHVTINTNSQALQDYIQNRG